MSQAVHSDAWVGFNYFSMGIAILMAGIGIFYLPVDLAVKGFFAMVCVMLVHTSVSLTKTIRDIQENKKLTNRIEDAHTERLLATVREAA